MKAQIKKIMKEIKEEDFNSWKASFWLIKRKKHPKDKSNSYSAMRVDIDDKLPRRFRGYLKKQRQDKKYHLESYDYSNADCDDVLLTIESEITDFSKIEIEIGKGFDNARATSYSDLLNSWAYVVLFEEDNKKLYAWKKISADTQPKKVASKNTIFFHNHKLVDLEDKEVFVIYPNYDFFVYQSITFISSKRQFESSMNFREGMKEKSDQVLSDFQNLSVFKNIELIKEHVGENLHRLRKMASILKSGYYKQTDYIEKLISVSKEENWELKVEEGKIVVEEETIDLLLKLLNNDRLRSPINNETFDASAKSRVD
ncbi:DUF4868 domain-containing protein [Aggregatibacter actinomycetemcomitans]|uniref:DUF4868 domain-containing protein n=1 Tax=Aggregatibacter actinomycetemcomitans TaxID=714 RepID=UPI00022AD604|nr:DUF4868 domain-containing protein [Aggregatibacter actinomycetemcomitans]ANU82999.1 DUF4868 domain-containing protein [Aggregatibacter actinomycetemcomitans]KOE65086.1 hypothetical protein I63B_0307670 [Aggregatibacter actinomycetemcomitans serotype d str. I63B]KYK84095.1 hypothetical protein SA3033_04435 [Aggregatibacter actinomycetemcomitans serotype d str. SA3033]KYK85580.1 hypothetical protein SA2200_09235 [Aggregatibacter actinomycetemcomitans serotype d str. SA2200]MBN6073334.1 DUF486